MIMKANKFTPGDTVTKDGKIGRVLRVFKNYCDVVFNGKSDWFYYAGEIIRKEELSLMEEYAATKTTKIESAQIATDILARLRDRKGTKTELMLSVLDVEGLKKIAATRSEWVSVEERMPEKGDSVLTYPHFKVLPFGNSKDEKEGNWSDSDFWVFENNHVKPVTPYPTHWQPLPQSPKQ